MTKNIVVVCVVCALFVGAAVAGEVAAKDPASDVKVVVTTTTLPAAPAAEPAPAPAKTEVPAANTVAK